MFWLAKSTISVFFGIIAFFIFKEKKNFLNNLPKSKIYQLSILLVLFLTLEYWILGPYSYISMVDESDHGLSRILHDQTFIGGKFLHNILGGSDFYASQLHGGQYFSLERIVLGIFPTWIGILFLKLVIYTINFFGLFLILKKFTKNNLLGIFSLCLFAAVFNPYATNNTLQHGLGYGLIPLSIYLFIFCNHKKNYLLNNFFLSLIISSSISFTHSFLAIFFSIVIFAIFFIRKNFFQFIFSILILLLIVFLNWSEVIYGFLEYSKITDRGLSKEILPLFYHGLFGSIPNLFFKTNLCFVNCSFQYSPFIIIIFLSLVTAILQLTRENKKLLLIILISIYLPVIIKFTNFLNIDTLKTINYFNIGLFLIVPSSIILIKIKNNQLSEKIFLFIIALSITIIFYNKAESFKELLVNGGQNRISNIQNIKKDNWINKKDAKIITTMPYKFFHPNFVWTYGHETFDGYINLIPSIYVDYWRYGIFNDKFKKGNYYRNGDLYINYTLKNNPFTKKKILFNEFGMDLNNYSNLNILKLLNVGYILSYTKIKEAGLNEISGPEEERFKVSSGPRNKSFYLNSFKELSNYIVSPPDLFIYELNNFSDKFYFPKKKSVLTEDLPVDEKMQYMNDNYAKNIVFVNNSLANIKLGEGNLKKIKQIKDGYKIEVDVTKDGLAVFNQIYLPFWKLYIDGKKRDIIKVNHEIMGLYLKKRDKVIEFKYERELLRERYTKNL